MTKGAGGVLHMGSSIVAETGGPNGTQNFTIAARISSSPVTSMETERSTPPTSTCYRSTLARPNRPHGSATSRLPVRLGRSTARISTTCRSISVPVRVSAAVAVETSLAAVATCPNRPAWSSCSPRQVSWAWSLGADRPEFTGKANTDSSLPLGEFLLM